jgi:uncharacterized protein involved in outer membrane biogenesis
MLSKTKIILAAIGLTLIVLATQADRLAKMALVAYLEQRLGATVEIRGPLRLSPGTTTTISAKDIHVIHPKATFEANIIELSTLSRSLLSQTPKITNLSIGQANLSIKNEPEPDGREQNKTVEISALDPELAIDKFEKILQDMEQVQVQIDRAYIYQSRFSYQDADQNISLSISESTMVSSTDRVLDLAVAGILNQANLTLEAKIERPENVYKLYTKAQWSGYNLELDGHVEHLNPLQNVDIVVKADGPSAAPLLQLLGAKEVRDGPLSLVTHLHDQDQRLIWFSHASVGELIVHSQFAHSLFDSDFSLDFETSGPSLREAGALIDYLKYSEQPFTASGTLTRDGDLLTLQESRITLGDGHFEASGVLPSFPAWDNWKLDIAAKDFDLTILQPFSPCEIPNLAMDWTGSFSSNDNGNEVFKLSLVGYGRAISLVGELGVYPELVGSSIQIESDGLDLNILSRCIGLPLQGEHPFATSMQLTRTDSAWEIENWELESGLLTTQSKGAISAEGLLNSDVRVQISDLNNLSVALGTKSYFNAAKADVEFSLTGQGRRFAVSAGKVSTDSSKGSFKGHIDDHSELRDVALDLNLSGTDIQKLMRDSPKLIEGLPFTLSAKLTDSLDGKIKADATIALADNQIRLQAKIPRTESLQDLTIKIDGRGGDLEHMLGSFVPYPLPSEPFEIGLNLTHRGDSVTVENLLLETAGQKLTAELTLDLAPNLSQTRGQLSLRGDSSNTLLNLVGFRNNFLDEPYQIQLDLIGNQDSMIIHLDNSSIGASDISGQISVAPSAIYQVSFDLTSKRIHLPTFIPTLITATDDKKDPITKKERVLPQIKFPWRWLSGIELDFSHMAERVDLRPGSFSSTQLAFTIKNGSLFSQNISWQSSDSDGTAVLVAQRDATDSESGSIKFEIVSERIPMLWLYTGSPITNDGERLQFNAKLDSKGKTTQELSKNLNGVIIFRGGGGGINTEKLDTLFGDFLLQLTKRVFSTTENQTKVLCTGGAFTIENGKVNLDPGLAIRTSLFDILASGEINLPDETLKLQLNSRPRQGIGVSAMRSLVPSVGIRGTMAIPKIQMSAAGTALSGGAAIASSGLSIIASGLWDRLRSSLENPCDAVYSRAIKSSKIGFGVLANGVPNSPPIKIN